MSEKKFLDEIDQFLGKDLIEKIRKKNTDMLIPISKFKDTISEGYPEDPDQQQEFKKRIFETLEPMKKQLQEAIKLPDEVPPPVPSESDTVLEKTIIIGEESQFEDSQFEDSQFEDSQFEETSAESREAFMAFPTDYNFGRVLFLLLIIYLILRNKK